MGDLLYRVLGLLQLGTRHVLGVLDLLRHADVVVLVARFSLKTPADRALCLLARALALASPLGA